MNMVLMRMVTEDMVMNQTDVKRQPIEKGEWVSDDQRYIIRWSAKFKGKLELISPKMKEGYHLTRDEATRSWRTRIIKPGESTSIVVQLYPLKAVISW